jgi:hypothetical protein
MTPLQTKYYECYQDKSRIKLIENFFTTYDATCRKTSQFLLFPRQKAFLNALSTGNEVIAIKHRQAGITTISAAWIAGQCAFSKPESPETILCIANQRGMAEELLDKIIGFIDQIPRWMWGPDYYSPDKNNEKNKRSIYVKQNKAEFELFNGCKGYARSAGKNASRGISAVSILIFDEAAFIENPVEVYSAATAATSSVMGAKTIMVSTPNGKDLLYYKTYSQALSHENNFTAVEFKWFQDLRYNRHLQWYKKNEETGEVEWITEPVVDNLGNIPYDEEKWRKLENDGWKATSPWYVKMCKKFNNDSRMIAQELEVSFLGSSDNVVAPDVIEYQRDKNVIKIDESWPLRDPLTPETWIWEDPNPSHRYILACDPSSGSGEDSTSIQVIDCDAVDETGTPYFNQVLEYNGKRTGDEIAVLIDRYGRVYNNALVVVEDIGGWGSACLLSLRNMKYPNLYYDETALKKYTDYDPNRRYSNVDIGRTPGFKTNSVRPQMLSNFAAALTNNTFRVRSMRVINELDTWIWKNGRPDHMTGFHDDSITCLAMGLFVMEFYMFKKIKDAQKDAKMIHSWRSSATIKPKDEIKPTDDIDISKPRKLPIYSSYQLNKQKSNRVKAFIMLGGFKTKKST